MDPGYVLLEAIIIFVLAAYSFWCIGFPIILDIIWYKRVKSGKSPKFGPLGIISIIVTVSSILYLPVFFTIIVIYSKN